MSTERFLARQPIFDAKEQIYGYELLFRNGVDNFFHSENPDQESSSVIVDSFLFFGIDRLTGGTRAFINCSRDVLLKGHVALLPKNKVVVEVLETVAADDEVLGACQRLKAEGYTIALDDFRPENHEGLLEVADIIKVDVLQTPLETTEHLVYQCEAAGIKMLAEKVESREVFRRAADMGYRYFQGYFFRMPQLLSGRDVPGHKVVYLRALQAINSPDMNVREIEQIIKADASLTYKLLRYLNSAMFAFRGQIKSLRHALALLGQAELRKWISLLAMAGLGEDKPPEIVDSAVIRAHFCESLASKVGLAGRETDLFLLGLLSIMEVILDRSMTSILTEIPVADEVRAALLGRPNRFREVYELVVAYEDGNWERFSSLTSRMKLAEACVPELHLKSVEWAKQVRQHT